MIEQPRIRCEIRAGRAADGLLIHENQTLQGVESGDDAPRPHGVEEHRVVEHHLVAGSAEASRREMGRIPSLTGGLALHAVIPRDSQIDTLKPG